MDNYFNEKRSIIDVWQDLDYSSFEDFPEN